MDTISFDSFSEIVVGLENTELAALCLSNKQFQEYCGKNWLMRNMVKTSRNLAPGIIPIGI